MNSSGPEQLTDGFGRVHRDLRISVTDRCNFRCSYCMPAEGLDWLPRSDVLSYEEITRIARICVERFGFDGVRLTGGEPTLRADLPVLIEQLSALNVDLSLTTNGTTLRRLAPALVTAGLSRINISCDSLRADRFATVTRRDELAKVLDGIDAAIKAGLAPIKLNVVAMRGVNEDELVDFAEFGRTKGIVVRFIEFMPLDAQGDWTNEQVLTQDEIVAAINAVHPLEPLAERGNAPAERWKYRDGGGEIGVIASVTHAFCDSCDRVRLTADGMLRHCLFATRELDLRTLLRSDATDDDIADAIRAEVGAKWAGHQINQVHFIRPSRSMSQIGG
ncbi:MAG: GTP 3',8-cyclase MoaA [Actinobacteria bacterium]|uniref:GTP 3',8-cyclase n=1 Tax=freshwater metagenome TaxID=449393 RepID=A0A6J5YDF8_9ZZZZ|nr:GTP 3',8-cyclase MoaA [Actinomycetota bacterium]MTA78531.1 GTP 3',8-cyclase MoaA [Actinomycetota bacterium]